MKRSSTRGVRQEVLKQRKVEEIDRGNENDRQSRMRHRGRRGLSSTDNPRMACETSSCLLSCRVQTPRRTLLRERHPPFAGEKAADAARAGISASPYTHFLQPLRKQSIVTYHVETDYFSLSSGISFSRSQVRAVTPCFFMSPLVTLSVPVRGISSTTSTKRGTMK